ncbi:MAG: aspartate carbamoyltransferase [Candidatus Woesearchaeota archaeon]
MRVNFKNRDIVAIDDFSKEDLEYLIQKTKEMRQRELSGQRYSNELKNKKLALLFYQDSTRTRTSFETAMKELGGDVCGFSGTEGTSVKKNESLYMTIKMYEANHADAIAIRHPKDGSVQWAADCAEVPVINCGDGANEHPTQAILDLCTIDHFHSGITGVNIGYGNDLKNGRTVHSDCIGLSKFPGVTLHLAAPEQLMMPDYLMALLESRGVKIVLHKTVRSAMQASEIYYQTRPQVNLEKRLTAAEMYRICEGHRITTKQIEGLSTKLMHPMPIDSHNEEIEFAVTFTKNQAFLLQAENGILSRKASLLEILKDTEYIRFKSSYCSDELNKSNNKVYLIRGENKNKGRRYIDEIDNGIAVDHIEIGMATEIEKSLNLESKRPTVLIGKNMRPYGKVNEPKKDVMKIFNIEPTQRIIKHILIKSPDATINVIRGGERVEKFKALLCENDNCITRDIPEDVPPKFYYEHDQVKCHYCRKPHSFNLSVTPEEKENYIKGLPKK